MLVTFHRIQVSAPESRIRLAAIQALHPIRRGKYWYIQDQGRVFLLNRPAILAAGAAELSGWRREEWLPIWRRQFPLKEVVRA